MKHSSGNRPTLAADIARAQAEVSRLATAERFAIAVAAGIFNPDGTLTEYYLGQGSVYRPA